MSEITRVNFNKNLDEYIKLNEANLRNDGCNYAIECSYKKKFEISKQFFDFKKMEKDLNKFIFWEE